MPERQRSDLRSGLFIVISFALMVGIIVGIKGISAFFEPGQVRKVTFALSDNLAGLRVGDEVRVGGFKVGTIKTIDVEHAGSTSEDKQPRILVTFSVPKKYVIHQDAKVGVDGTLTGQSWLNFISLGSPAAAQQPVDQPLVGMPSPLTQVFASAATFVPEFQAALSDIRRQTVPRVNGVLDDVRSQTVPRVNTTVDKFGQTADSFKKTGDQATALAADLRGPVIEKYHKVADAVIDAFHKFGGLFGDITSDFRTSVSNIAAATTSIKEKFPPILEKLDTTLGKATGTMDQLNAALKDVQAAVANTKDFTGSLKGVVSGNRSKLEGMIASLKTTSDNLKNASAEIRRSPWRLLYQPKEGELENLAIYDAARQFAEGANDLNDAAGALRDALKDNDADQAQLQKLMDRVDQSFNNFNQVEQKLWNSVKK